MMAAAAQMVIIYIRRLWATKLYGSATTTTTKITQQQLNSNCEYTSTAGSKGEGT